MVENRDLTNLDLAGRGWENCAEGCCTIGRVICDGGSKECAWEVRMFTIC